MRRGAHVLACIGLVLVVALIGFTAGSGMESWATLTLINICLVIGLYTFSGNSGVLSFGHMAFAALGAYTVALLTLPAISKGILLPNLPSFLASAEVGGVVALLIGGLVGAAAGLIAGVPLMRLNGIAAGIGTLALLIIVNVVLVNTPSLTGGQDSLSGIPLATTLGSGTVWTAAIIVIAAAFTGSRVGLKLRAAREEEVAARATGVSVFPERLMAFTLSAFITALAGGLYVQHLGTISADALFLQYTFMVVAMLVVGGVRSLSGAVIGAIVVSGLSEILLRLEAGQPLGPLQIETRPGVREIVLALFLLLVLARRPDGLTRGRELFSRRFGKSAEPEAEPGA